MNYKKILLLVILIIFVKSGIIYAADPVVALSSDYDSGYVPLSVTLTASAYDTDGTVDLYEWDFDGDDSYDTSFRLQQ